MKYSCKIIQDLIPLYSDKVCSDESVRAVEEHMEECDECKKYYRTLQESNKIEKYVHTTEFQQQQVESMKQVKKEIHKKSTKKGVIGIVIGVLAAVIAVYVLIWTGILGVLIYDIANTDIQVYTDIAQYKKYIGENSEYSPKWDMDETILPQEITEDMKVKDFQFVYYNPWDAQYLTYLTVEYTEEAYQKEMNRLSEKGIDSYTDYYSVTGAPSGYEMVAMDADSYQGFVYAMTPESGENMITYVEIIFCNYLLDLDINEYMPEKYILEGFDASEDNEYRKEQLKQ